ncbi:MAG: AMP-binding protein [Pseudomonadales bacterium]|nr:AMP-binding protein [Pseudomonadales bacterium]
MESLQTPLELFYRCEKERANSVWLHQPNQGQWDTYTWELAGNYVRRLAAALTEMNLPKGSKIAILSKNSVYWYFSDLAIMMSGHVSIPAFTTMDAKGTRFILENSETQVMFVGPSDNWDAVAGSIPEHIQIISLPGISIDGCYATMESLIEQHSPYTEDAKPNPNDLCTIIYTSGTTGQPKGVMHSHSSLAAAGKTMVSTYNTSADDRFLSFLPLSHIFERAVFMQSLASGGQVYFNESIDSFPGDLVHCRPTRFFAPPRIWQKFQQAILAKLGEEKLSAMLANETTAKQLAAMVQQTLGLDQAEIRITGGGQTPLELYDWYRQLGMPLFDVYGMTEAAPAATNLPQANKEGTVGRAVAGAHIKIAENGEILTRTPCMMMGYYKNPKKTQEDLAGGWMHTGDIGKLDADGYLKVTGRIKEIFKTAKGKYVAPTKIENLMFGIPFVEHLCLTGSGLPAPVLIVNLSAIVSPPSTSKLKAILQAKLSSANEQLEKHERVSHILVTDEPWTINNSLLTHTTKVKRQQVEAKYTDKVMALCDQFPFETVVMESTIENTSELTS